MDSIHSKSVDDFTIEYNGHKNPNAYDLGTAHPPQKKNLNNQSYQHPQNDIFLPQINHSVNSSNQANNSTSYSGRHRHLFVPSNNINNPQLGLQSQTNHQNQSSVLNLGPNSNSNINHQQNFSHSNHYQGNNQFFSGNPHRHLKPPTENVRVDQNHFHHQMIVPSPPTHNQNPGTNINRYQSQQQNQSNQQFIFQNNQINYDHSLQDNQQPRNQEVLLPQLNHGNNHQINQNQFGHGSNHRSPSFGGYYQQTQGDRLPQLNNRINHHSQGLYQGNSHQPNNLRSNYQQGTNRSQSTNPRANSYQTSNFYLPGHYDGNGIY